MDETLKTFLENFDRSAYVKTVEAIAGEKVFERKVDAKETDNQGKGVKYSLKDLTEEEQNIIATAKANGTYLKAPNGKRTNLTSKQWVQVRTKAFKRWFGDWELAAQMVNVINITKHHIFDVSKKVQVVKRDAIDYAKSNGIIRTVSNDETGGKGEIIIAPRAIRKIVDDAYGSRPNIHIMLDAIAYLPKLIKESKLAEEHLSYEKGEDGVRRPENGINPKETIFRYYGAIAKEGKVYRSKITIKRDNENQSQRAYTYEVMKIELTSGNTDSKKEDIPTLDNSISFAKLLQNVENDNKNGEKILDFSKIVDENGEPKVVYHRTPNKFTAFDARKIGSSSDFGAFGRGFYFSPYKEQYRLYGRYLISAFLNVRNPFNLNEDNVYDTKMSFGMSPEGQRGWTRKVSEEFTQWLKDNNYDGVVYKTNYNEEEDVVFNPNQIKSADVVTYDDAGNIIPLSERFNPEKEDIRYSLREATSEEVKEYLTDALRAAYADRLEQIDKRYDYIADTAKTLY